MILKLKYYNLRWLRGFLSIATLPKNADPIIYVMKFIIHAQLKPW